jgi:GNAT superfamily N-acetyltransferase
VIIAPITALPGGFPKLIGSAKAEGFQALTTLARNFQSGTNRFARTGEVLLTLWDGDDLLGVGGLNRDPYFPKHDVGRLRHLYVLPSLRSQGLGRSLVEALEARAQDVFPMLQLFTQSVRAGTFYEALGYQPVQGENKVSHRKALASQP